MLTSAQWFAGGDLMMADANSQYFSSMTCPTKVRGLIAKCMIITMMLPAGKHGPIHYVLSPTVLYVSWFDECFL